MINKSELIKKLEKRIHNQRVALKRNWQIQEEQMNHKPTTLRSMWFKHVVKLAKQVSELKRKLNS